jgi:hypothetical protein
MADNEAVFRRHNEKIQKRFEELQRIAEEDDQLDLAKPDDSPLFFYCECSDENCLERVEMKPSRYAAIHKRRDYFVITPGHEVEEIETVVRKAQGYNVVQKHVEASEDATNLKDTPVDNS